MNWGWFVAAALAFAVGAPAQRGGPPPQGSSASPQYRASPGYAAYDRAASLFAAQDFQGSMNAIDEALRLDPKLVPALTLKAKMAMAIDRYDVARECLERALAADRSSWYAQFLYGFHFYKQNEMPAAIAALEKARALNPRDASTALYLGLAQESLGRTKEALALYKESIRLEEAAGKLHMETLLTYSRLLLLLGDFGEDERVLEHAVKLDPKSRDPHFEAGRLLLKKGEPQKAAAEGERALALRSGDITDRQAHYLLVQAYQAAGREDDAARHASALRALDESAGK